MYNFVEQGDRKNPTVLFLHGFMGCAADWTRDVIPNLADDFHCVAVDLPGHGKTMVPDESHFGMEVCARDMVSLLDEWDTRPISVVGYSMGGRLALYMAVNYPDRFDKVIIESSSPGLRSREERRERIIHDEQLAQKVTSVPLERFVRDWYRQPVFQSLDQTTPGFQALFQRRLANDPIGLGLSLRLMGTGAQASLWEQLDKITADLLLIVGEHDAKFRDIAHEMACRRGNTTVLEMRDAGHNVHYEAPKEYAEQVRLFLKGLL